MAALNVEILMRITIMLITLACGTAAHAELITEVRSVPATPTDWARTLEFTPFDPALGTVTGVRLSARSHIDHTFAVTAPGIGSVTLTAGPTTVGVGPLTLAAPAITRVLDAGAAGVPVPPASFDLSGALDLPATPGPWTFDARALSFSSFGSDSGNGSGEVTTTAGVEADLSYEYTPRQSPVAVPTPPSVLMGLIGLLAGLGAVPLFGGREG